MNCSDFNLAPCICCQVSPHLPCLTRRVFNLMSWYRKDGIKEILRDGVHFIDDKKWPQQEVNQTLAAVVNKSFPEFKHILVLL